MNVGPTGIPNPNAAYVNDLNSLYFNGFHGTSTDVIYPASDNFGPSVTAGENALVTDVLNLYDTGQISAAHPLLLDGYSQGSMVIGDAESILAKDGIPSADIHILLLGDTAAAPTFVGGVEESAGWLSTIAGPGTLMGDVMCLIGWCNIVGNATPDNFYPTEVVTVNGDNWADAPNAGSSLIHDSYLGLTPAELATATPIIEGLTTYFDVPQTATQLLDSLLVSILAL